MRLALGIGILSAILWFTRPWNAATVGGVQSAGAWVVGGLCLVLAVWRVRVWLRQRWRRRMRDMRDSALW